MLNRSLMLTLICIIRNINKIKSKVIISFQKLILSEKVVADLSDNKIKEYLITYDKNLYISEVYKSLLQSTINYLYCCVNNS